MTQVDRARRTIEALYPDGAPPPGELARWAKVIGVSQTAMQVAALHVRASRGAAADSEPDATPWFPAYNRGYLDGVLAMQRLRIVTIEPPPGVAK